MLGTCGSGAARCALAYNQERKFQRRATFVQRDRSFSQSARTGDVKKGIVCDLRSDAVTKAFDQAVMRARARYLEECKKRGILTNEHFIVDLLFHGLRHEATSRLAAIFPMHELINITGHKDPQMLMRYYHPKAEELAKRLESLNCQ